MTIFATIHKPAEKLYLPAITPTSMETALKNFSLVLDDFPDPVFCWVDESTVSVPVGVSFAKASVDLKNDQETIFTFSLTALNNDEKETFRLAVENLITENFQRVEFDQAFFKRTFYPRVTFASENPTKVVEISYHVYWKHIEM